MRFSRSLASFAAIAAIAGAGVAVASAPASAVQVNLGGAPSTTIIVDRGQNNTLQLNWAVNGTQNWNTEQVAGPGTTYSAPSWVYTTNDAENESSMPNGVAIAAEGPNGTLDYYWNPDYVNDPSQWTLQVIPGTIASAPSIADTWNWWEISPYSLEIAAEGPGNTLVDFLGNVGSGSPWIEKQVDGPNSAYSAPSLSYEPGCEYLVSCSDPGSSVIAVEGPYNSLKFYWMNDGPYQWSSAEQIAGTGTTFSAPSISQQFTQDTSCGPFGWWECTTEGSNDVVARGPDNTLDFYWQIFGSPGWTNPPQQIGGIGMAIAAPSISTDQFDQPNLQIASVGAGNTLWYAWQNNGDSSWNTQLVNGNLSTLSPPSIAAVGGGGTVMSTMGWGVLDLYWTQSPNYGSNPPSWGLEQIPGVVPWS